MGAAEISTLLTWLAVSRFSPRSSRDIHTAQRRRCRQQARNVQQLTHARTARSVAWKRARPARIHPLAGKRHDGKGRLSRAIIPHSLDMAVIREVNAGALYAASDPFRSTS